MEKSLAGTETYGCSTGHLLSKEPCISEILPRQRAVLLQTPHLLPSVYLDWLKRELVRAGMEYHTERCFIFRNVLLAAVTNFRELFNRAVIKIAIKIEYAEVPLSSASLIVHPVDSQFVKEHRTMTVRSQVNQKSYPWLSSVCCECHSREQELLVAVLRSVSKIQLLLCYQTK
ncbi:hypothetical protein MTR67_019347 [Solanum verrucosum]|uniref:Uncharacterized protein n=1 Tax=Solanum verrucosum TaxID=315347 RepID=A0AAF0QLD3_SOLVR|nr:hypothetical protein MTR67_019347 [Solanum verrucosum]